jgi:replicative DNA helicase
MLSRHIQNKISRIKDPEEKLTYLKQEKVKEKANELFLDEHGNDRFMLIDERDGSVEVLQDKIEELIISCGCKVIILDPLSDIMDALTVDEQAKFMKWCKSMIKNYNCTFLMIAHIRKSGSNKDAASTGAFIPEEAITGSSTIFKSASWVVMMMRDKYNEDPVVRNTTKLILSKNRSGVKLEIAEVCITIINTTFYMTLMSGYRRMAPAVFD